MTSDLQTHRLGPSLEAQYSELLTLLRLRRDVEVQQLWLLLYDACTLLCRRVLVKL